MFQRAGLVIEGYRLLFDVYVNRTELPPKNPKKVIRTEMKRSNVQK